MQDFFRFPHTSHLDWLGKEPPRDDKVLSSADARLLLENSVVVEEKLDGANVGFSLAPDGSLRIQNRGQYLIPPYAGQFSRLPDWLAQHETALKTALTSDIILFGEWCAARHSLEYDTLPDWFLLFDVYDKNAGLFWSVARRNALAKKAEVCQVAQFFSRKCTLDELIKVVNLKTSNYRQGMIEGVVVRYDSADWCEMRAKLVRSDFSQAIGQHWRKRIVEWNRIRLL